MSRIDEEQVDRLIDRALRGEPIPRGVLMMALLACEVRAERPAQEHKEVTRCAA